MKKDESNMDSSSFKGNISANNITQKGWLATPGIAIHYVAALRNNIDASIAKYHKLDSTQK